MPASYRRIDTTDPRRFDRVVPFTLPGKWADDSPDLYEMLLSSSTVASGAAMLTRQIPVAFVGLVLSAAHVAHYKPLQKRREGSQQAGPYMGLGFALIALIVLIFQKVS
ncbi:right border a protein [Ceraceosorus guamensis]|uniref:Right border a protein n=1 Tax=Ceraceosorus guamensis TaxID=1522189 RepID=A0A316W376_9BASI|nr:right border a protein [Ceraceosorus guamensis]PWN44172.1 right border a protein [Ceraceosorus guamensis]